jgi:CDP-glycerol glycerophosphotransferase
MSRRLPPARRSVLFESWRGRYADSPRSISEELGRRDLPLHRVWVVDDSRADIPEDVTPVRRHGPAYLYYLFNARHVVSNDLLASYYRKLRPTDYVQTWHGTPLKRIGFDIADPAFSGGDRYLGQLARESGYWRYLVSPNAFSTEVFRRAFRYDGEVLETGYPRNDVLVHGDPAAVERVRRQFAVPDDRRIILYAPTWRDGLVDASGRPAFPTALDLDRLDAAVGSRYVVLVRGHRLNENTVPALLAPIARDATGYPDISDLYLAADALVTDYSSVMFDFAVTGRPMLFFTYDLARYRDELRGFYFDFEAEAPGPLLTTTDDLIDALVNLDAVTADHAGAYERFVERFCGLEDGHAAARVVNRVFEAT